MKLHLELVSGSNIITFKGFDCQVYSRQFLVRATFSSFSRPSYIEILVLSIFFFKVSNPPR